MDNEAGAGTNSPVELRVVIGNMTEPELMAALEQVVMHWQHPWMLTGVHGDAIGRAVRWLHDKYGRTTNTRRAGMDAKTNGALPASPVRYDDGTEYGGLTKREAFAMAAMQGVMAMQSNPDVIEAVAICAKDAGKSTDEYIASNCFSLADALLAALSQEPQ